MIFSRLIWKGIVMPEGNVIDKVDERLLKPLSHPLRGHAMRGPYISTLSFPTNIHSNKDLPTPYPSSVQNPFPSPGPHYPTHTTPIINSPSPQPNTTSPHIPTRQHNLPPPLSPIPALQYPILPHHPHKHKRRLTQRFEFPHTRPRPSAKGHITPSQLTISISELFVVPAIGIEGVRVGTPNRMLLAVEDMC